MKGDITYPISCKYTVEGTEYFVATQLYKVGVYCVITQGSKTLQQLTYAPSGMKKFMNKLATLHHDGKITEISFGREITVYNNNGLLEERVEPFEEDESFDTTIALSRDKGGIFTRKAKIAFKLYDEVFYVHRNYANTGFIVSSFETGACVVARKYATETDAIKEARKVLLLQGKEKVQEVLSKLPKIKKLEEIGG